jgi:preprotein translocase subunit SecE
MKKPRPTRPKAIKERAAQTAAVITPSSPVAAEAPKKPGWNPFKLLQDTRAEVRKITWTSRRETWITSVMVFLMVAVCSTFFFFLDRILSIGTATILKLATAGS